MPLLQLAQRCTAHIWVFEFNTKTKLHSLIKSLSVSSIAKKLFQSERLWKVGHKFCFLNVGKLRATLTLRNALVFVSMVLSYLKETMLVNNAASLAWIDCKFFQKQLYDTLKPKILVPFFNRCRIIKILSPGMSPNILQKSTTMDNLTTSWAQGRCKLRLLKSLLLTSLAPQHDLHVGAFRYQILARKSLKALLSTTRQQKLILFCSDHLLHSSNEWQPFALKAPIQQQYDDVCYILTKATKVLRQNLSKSLLQTQLTMLLHLEN